MVDVFSGEDQWLLMSTMLVPQTDAMQISGLIMSKGGA